jgi:hypothetical protein
MRRHPKANSPKIEEGCKVRVLAGPFAGRVGAVTELDGKGGARVTFGPLQAHLELANLGHAGERGTRPALRSSHWRFDATGPGEDPGAKGGKQARRARVK